MISHICVSSPDLTSKEIEPVRGVSELTGSSTRTLLCPLGSMRSLEAVTVTRTLEFVAEKAGLMTLMVNLTVEPDWMTLGSAVKESMISSGSVSSTGSGSMSGTVETGTLTALSVSSGGKPSEEYEMLAFRVEIPAAEAFALI